MRLPRPQPAALRQLATECHDGEYGFSSTLSEGRSMTILTVGIDLAKNAFAVHGVHEVGVTD